MNLKTRLLCLWLVLFSGVIFSLESAETLPKNIFRVYGVTTLTADVHNQYKGDGHTEGLGKTKSVNAKELAEFDSKSKNPKNFSTLYEVLGKIQPELGDALLDAKVDLSVNAQLSVSAFALMYGVTDRFSMGLVIPVYYFKQNSSLKTHTKNSIKDIKKQLGTLNRTAALDDKLKTVEKILPEMNNIIKKEMVTGRGYYLPEYSSGTYIGKLELGLRRRWLDNPRHEFATQLSIKAPTSNFKKDYHNIAQPEIIENQWELAPQLLYDWKPYSSWRLSTSAKYTFALSKKVRKPFPKVGSPLPIADLTDPYQWDNVTVDPGDYVETEIGLYKTFDNDFWEVFTLFASKFRFKENITGGSKNLTYKSAASGSASETHHLGLGFGFNTINKVLNKELLLPVKFRGSYNRAIAGVNSPQYSYWRVDFDFFF